MARRGKPMKVSVLRGTSATLGVAYELPIAHSIPLLTIVCPGLTPGA
jgi:hypothetical protein